MSVMWDSWGLRGGVGGGEGVGMWGKQGVCIDGVRGGVMLG